MAVVLAAYRAMVRRPAVQATLRLRHPLAFVAGFLVLWAMLDWPIGLLGAGYLLSVHTGQWVLVTLVAMPLLLLAVPAAAWPRPGSSRGATVLRQLAHPGIGLALYTVTMALTHVPAVTDGLKQTQLGSFAIDLAWLLGAFALWWPVQAPAGYVRISPPLRIGYLFLATIPPIVPAAFMVFADYPLYSLYELAPRVAGIAAHTDQQVAGLVMKAGADPLLWIEMLVVFLLWQRGEERKEAHASAQELQGTAS
jgi:putative membrane protein